ncbi:MAG: hypothetical protein JW839_12990 [Candidatus Lokiarchaeota archaeon]|nr:hypothetical protein [Candidatus Lokiarchaeota archaeon]
MASVEKRMEKSGFQKGMIIFWIAMLAIPAVLIPVMIKDTKTPPVVERYVMANLYTWYGTPTGPLGQHTYMYFQRNGSATDWGVSGSNMSRVANTTVQSAFVATGECTNIVTNGHLELSIPADGFSMPKDRKTGTWYRVYFALNASINSTDASVTFNIKKGGMKFTSPLPLSISFSMIYLVFPFNFTGTAWNGTNELTIEATATAVGNFSLAVASMSVGSWGHYHEDYHTYYDMGLGTWMNDPPFSKATDKNVHFTSNISDALGPIPSYGNYTHPWTELGGPDMEQVVLPNSYLGIYDSLDPVAIEAQLRLMWWAGIDVVMLMHPNYFEVATTVMDVAWNIKERFDALKNNSNFGIKFVYYNNWERMSDLLYQIRSYAHYNDLYLKVNGGPVIYVGPTGLLEEPYANYANGFDAIRQAHHGVCMIGDGYIPPKEEMLDLLDGFYFYDTSGLFRQGYGDPHITVYQDDGSPSWGQGKLGEVFTATSSIVHAHGCIYAATVIPGLDNTCVHGFAGTPLDEAVRPGTIVGRAGGLTFNYTWQCAVAAGAEWITITSWNELHEGTEIEPTAENGTFYIELCRTWSSQQARGVFKPLT